MSAGAVGAGPMSAGAVGAGPMSAGLRLLGPVDQIPLGEGRAFGVDGDQVAVFRLRDGTLRALSAVCPHKGGPIADGTIDQRVVLCPLHQHAFELDTGCSTTGAGPLRIYEVHVDQQQNIVLLVGAKPT
jgi:nitrite reductase (NADH) small subunit